MIPIRAFLLDLDSAQAAFVITRWVRGADAHLIGNAVFPHGEGRPLLTGDRAPDLAAEWAAALLRRRDAACTAFDALPAEARNQVMRVVGASTPDGARRVARASGRLFEFEQALAAALAAARP